MVAQRIRGRWLVSVTLVLLIALWAGHLDAVEERPVRIGITAVVPENQIRLLEYWKAYLEDELGREIQLIRRNNYAEIVELALRGRVDFAWICGFPYVLHRNSLDLLVTALYRGEPLYRSYFIVPASDDSTETLLDLDGGIFAFSDPNSNSGWLYPEYVLHQGGTTSESHFDQFFYTWSHRRVVEAVAGRLAEGGAVDGYVWDALSRTDPDLTDRTRVVTRSDPFGFPPIVATAAADDGMRTALRSVLLKMSEDTRGRGILRDMNLDGFDEVDPSLYDSIERLSREVANHQELPVRR